MTEVWTLADTKAHLSELVARAGTEHERFTVTVHGRPTAVLLAVADLEALEDTVAVLSDSGVLRALGQADAELARGEGEDRDSLDAEMKVRRTTYARSRRGVDGVSSTEGQAMLRRVGGVTGLMAIGFVLFAVIARDWPVAVMLVVVFACIALGQVAARSRARRRMSQARLSGTQRWRGRVIREGASLFDGRVWWTAFNDGAQADLLVSLDAVVLEPTGAGRKWGHLKQVRVPWADVVDARTRDLGRVTPEGKVSFVPLTEVTVLIVGELVPMIMRPDQLLAEEEHLTESERAEVDQDIASYLAAIRETVGDDYVFGVLPLVFLTPDASGLADSIKARARGSLPSE